MLDHKPECLSYMGFQGVGILYDGLVDPYHFFLSFYKQTTEMQ